MRVAIVNDLALAVEALRRALRAVPGVEVAWVARDGADAIRQCARDRPDLVLMDLIMPGIDGVAATREIMRRSPCPVLVVTASVRGNVGKVYEALGAGALDAVATPRLGLDGGLEGAADLARKIATVGALAREGDASLETPPAAPAPTPVAGRARPPLVAIGASTGGPHALATLLGALPAGLAAALVVVQHIDRLFAPGLASWLARRSVLPVTAITDITPLRAGTVTLAAGTGHLVLRGDLRLGFTREPAAVVHTPSIDVFFASAATRVRGRGCGVLLTGMGRDGARGLLALRRAGFHTIVQDEATSVVWGMPRAAIEAGAAAEVLPIEQIGPRVAALMEEHDG